MGNNNRTGTFANGVEWRWTFTALEAAHKLTPGTIAEQSQMIAMRHGEPLMIAMDAMLQYANSYRTRFEAYLSEDQVLGPHWLEAIKGVAGYSMATAP